MPYKINLTLQVYMRLSIFLLQRFSFWAIAFLCALTIGSSYGGALTIVSFPPGVGVSANWNASRQSNLPSYFGINQYLSFYSNGSKNLRGNLFRTNPTVFASTTLNLVTGDFTWPDSSFDATTYIWTRTSNAPWLFSAINKTWTNQTTSDVWTHNPTRHAWGIDGLQDGTYWRWNFATEVWLDTGTGYHWQFNPTAFTWTNLDSAPANPINFPPVPLCQQMYMLSIMKEIYGANIFDETNQAIWTLTTGNNDSYTGTNAAQDFSLTITPQSQTVTTISGSSEKALGSLTCTASFTNAAALGSFEWASTGVPAGLTEKWSFNKETGLWVSEHTGDTWSYNQSTNTFTSQANGDQWRADQTLGALSNSWTKVSDTTTWNFIPSQGVWRYTDGTTTWNYRFLFRSTSWIQVSTNGQAPSVSFPPAPVVQLVYVSTMNMALLFEGIVDFEWHEIDRSSTQVVFANTTGTATLTHVPTQNTFSYNLAHGGLEINTNSHPLAYVNRADPSAPISFTIDENLNIYENGSQTPAWHLDPNTLTFLNADESITWTPGMNGDSYQGSTYEGNWSCSSTSDLWTEDLYGSTWRYNFYLQEWEKVSSPTLPIEMEESYFPPHFFLLSTITPRLSNFTGAYNNLTGLKTTSTPYTVVKNSVTAPTLLRWTSTGGPFEEETAEYKRHTVSGQVQASLEWNTNANTSFLQNISTDSYSWDIPYDGSSAYDGSTHTWYGQNDEIWVYNPSLRRWTNSVTNTQWDYNSTTNTWSSGGPTWMWNPAQNKWTETTSGYSWRHNFSINDWCRLDNAVGLSNPMPPRPLVQQQYMTMIFNSFCVEGSGDAVLTISTEDDDTALWTNSSQTASLTHHKDGNSYSWVLGKNLEILEGDLDLPGWTWKNYSGERQTYVAAPVSGGLSFTVNGGQPSWSYVTSSHVWTAVGSGTTWTLTSPHVWSSSAYNGTWTYSPNTDRWTESLQDSTWRFNPTTLAWDKISSPVLNPTLVDGNFPPAPVRQMARVADLTELIAASIPAPISTDLDGDTARTNALLSLVGNACLRQANIVKTSLLTTLENIDNALNHFLSQEDRENLLNAQDGYENLLSRCNQVIVVATLQASTTDVLTNLCALNPLQLTAAATDAILQDAYDAATTAYIAAVMNNSVTDQDINEIFEEEKIRASLAGSTTGALRDFKAIQSTIAATFASLLSLPTHPIASFESNYTTAVNTLLSQMQGGIDQLSSALEPLDQLLQEDRASSDIIDEVFTAADRLKVVLTLWSSFLSARISQYTALKNILSGDLARRQLLFNAMTFAEKANLKTSIAATLPAQSTQVAAALSRITAAIPSLTIPPMTFQTLPQTPAGQGQLSNMRVRVNTKVELFNKQLTLLLQQLSVQVPSQALINQIIAGLAPAILLHQTATAMREWLTHRSTILTTSPLPTGYQDLKTGYLIEWNELLAVLTSALTSSALSNSTKSAIADLRTSNNFGLLTSATPTAQDFASVANRLSKRGVGEVDQIVALAIGEVQRLAGPLVIQNQAGITDASTAPLAITPPTPALIAIPGQPTQTITNNTVLTTPLSNDSTLVLTGNQIMPSRLRDPILNTSITNKLSANMRLFLNKSARVGLGSANISNTPGQSLNVLGGSSSSGENSIQLVADGNCFVDVNSDLIIGGSKPLVPTANFGKALHSITFTSPVERTITVLENTTWDLSDFAATGSGYVNYGKKIVFSGKIKLVLETGAKIRFPVIDPARKTHSVVLVFTQDAQLICQGNMRNVGRTWTSNQSDSQRNKILGMGELWLTGNAQMVVHKPALLGIEADYVTPNTDITFELTDAAQLMVGTDSIAGGALQIGNMFNGGSKEHPESTSPDSQFPNNTFNTNYNTSFTPRKTSIDFTLRLNGSRTQCMLGRQSFLGLATGVINKDGAETFDASPANGSWLLQHLYNVNNITIDITQGRFAHSIIADGDSSHCSVIGISPLAGGYPNCRYTLNLATDGIAQILGGGNLYFIDTSASMQAAENGTVTASPHTLEIADTCGSFNFSATNNGIYAPLSPLPGMFLRGDYLTPQASSRLFGRGFITSSTQAPYTFSGPAEEFFSAIKMIQYNDITERYVPIALLENNPLITYVNNQTITRSTLNATNLRDGSTADALSSTYIRGEKQSGGIPRRFSLPTD